MKTKLKCEPKHVPPQNIPNKLCSSRCPHNKLTKITVVFVFFQRKTKVNINMFGKYVRGTGDHKILGDWDHVGTDIDLEICS